MLLINATHESGCWWQDLVDEDEDGLFWAKLDPLSNNVDELADGEICWYKVLLLVDSRYVRFLCLLADYWDSVGILLTNTLGFSLWS